MLTHPMPPLILFIWWQTPGNMVLDALRVRVPPPITNQPITLNGQAEVDPFVESIAERVKNACV
jgi:hypothetical protein